MNQAAPYYGEEQAPHLAPAYLYIIRHDDGTQQHWTSYDRPVIGINIPTSLVPAGTAEFLPSQIKHGPIASNDRFEERTVTLAIQSDDERLRRFFIMAAAVKLECWIIRVSVEFMPESVDFLTQVFVVESGILGKFAFSGNTIAAELTPEPFYMGWSIPRHFFQRPCNHALYGFACGVDKTAHQFVSEILSVDSAEREIVIEGRKPAVGGDYFEAGMFDHPATGLKFAIIWSEHTGTDETLLKLSYWHPELAVGQALTAYAGCKHTVADCTARFDNAANFGGFPWVPSKNPVTNGV